MIRGLLAGLVIAAILLGSPSADAHYPPKPEPHGKTKLEQQHHRLHELKGHAWAMVKHPRTYRELVWHRKALRRINRRLELVHRELAFQRRVGAAWTWYRRGDTQCVVDHEGGWSSDSNPGYFGRFQMDVSFQNETEPGRTFYRRWGTADRWPDWAQVLHAYTIWRYAGWSRWPTYRRYCA